MRKQVVVGLFGETEGAVRYREVDSAGAPIHGDREGAILGDIYLRKAAISDKPPKRLKVTIED
jgi:hypothetical protein